MAIKEAILAAMLSTSPENHGVYKDNTSELLNSQKKIIQNVIESKQNPYKIDENLIKLALKNAENNPIKIDKQTPHFAQLSPKLQKHFFN